MVCPLQVFRATCRVVKPPSTKSLLSLPRLLKDKQAMKYFVMYCSTELSLENLLFYQCVKAWKSNSTDERLKEEGLQLYENFFAPGSVFELNLNDKTLQTVRDSFEAGECNRQIFDTAMDEVYEILVSSQELMLETSSNEYSPYRSPQHFQPSSSPTFASCTTTNKNLRRLNS